MAIDKLRLTTIRSPDLRFFSVVNSDLQRPRDQRLFEVRFRYADQVSVQPDTVCQITSGKRTYPFFFLNLNFSAQGMMIQPKQILELNPNNLSNGLRDLSSLIEFIFGSDPGDFTISRIDLNADIELPVEYFFRSLRIPLKRKSSRFEDQCDPIRSYTDRGLNTFYIGRSPALLRVYDKRQELRHLKKDVSEIPAVFTRLEWELRNKKCPISRLSELFEIEQFKPFEKVEIIDQSDDLYDFHDYPESSRKKFFFNKLSEEFGAHEAIRILSYGGNFKREYDGLLCEIVGIKERLQRSYKVGVEQFLGNRGPELDPLAVVLW